MEHRAHCEPLTPLDPLRISQAITDSYDNRRIASVNDHEIRMSVMTGGFPWHRHPDSDETFYGIDGELIVEFAHHQVVLKPGEFLTVPERRPPPHAARRRSLGEFDVRKAWRGNRVRMRPAG